MKTVKAKTAKVTHLVTAGSKTQNAHRKMSKGDELVLDFSKVKKGAKLAFTVGETRRL